MRSDAGQFEQFRALMELDPSLQEKLNQPDDPALFIALVVSSAHDHGLRLDAEQVAATIRANQPVSAAVSNDEGGAPLPPKGWLPVRTHWRDREFHVDWSYVGPRRLREPFF